MVRSLILFLNLCVFANAGFGQSAQAYSCACNCNDNKVKDSLIQKYLHNDKMQDYNSPAWPLYCDSLIALCPNIAESYQLKAIPFIKYGDYAKAFLLEDKAVALEPRKWTAYRGFLKCIFTKDYEGAIIDFKKAQELVPNNYEMDHTYFFYLGLCNLELRNYKIAEENFKQGINIEYGVPANESHVHFNSFLYLGILYYEMKLDNKAKEYLMKCLTIYKQHPDANYYLAMVYKREKHADLCKKYLQVAKESKIRGYSLNEGNMYYSYYPRQITLFEIEKELQ